MRLSICFLTAVLFLAPCGCTLKQRSASDNTKDSGTVENLVQKANREMEEAAKKLENAVKVEHDNYEKSTLVTGSTRVDPPGTTTRYAVWNWKAHLMGVLHWRSNKYSILFRVYCIRGSWVFLDRAVDIDGNFLPTTDIARDVMVNSGGVMEIVDIAMTKKYLEDHRGTGLDLKVVGSRGSLVVTYPPEYIESFLREFLPRIAKAQAIGTSIRE